MQPHPRYDVVGAIASGDFATVYRGRDKDLGREVAIKQIHQHYLNDPRRLEGFWKEAQLLASLAHPNVMTIYDIVRDRGWLILEFMQGNLRQYAGEQPLDVEVLRTALGSALEALSFLHKSGVTHGDVKPTNLLIDRLNRIKLGDFGLARRASNEQGSMLKGTTKYMAPELLSNQFGQVGPASDLYSLGFSIYELACGQQFDDLFPGLQAFGTDRQIAWMMWHAAPDRLAPPIERVFPNFPPDLAAVITRLIAKPQSQRYRTADEALRDLRIVPGTLPVDTTAEEEAARQKAAAKKKRMLSIGAFGLSAALSLAILFWPKPKPPEVAPVAPPPVSGIVRQVTPSREILIVEVDEDGIRKEIEVRLKDNYRVFLNDKATLLRDLKEQDHVVINLLKDAEGHELQEVQAQRAQADQGTIAAIKLDEATLTISTGDVQNSVPLIVSVPPTAKITINGRGSAGSAAYTLANLLVGDAVIVEHEPTDRGRQANSLQITRGMASQGTLTKVDVQKREVTWNTTKGATELRPVADPCDISLNGRRLLNKAALTLKDLLPGDEVSLVFEAQVTRIDAKRTFTDRGTIRNIAYDVKSIEVALDKGGQMRTFVIPADASIEAPGGNAFDALRRGDTVELTHTSPDGENIEVSKLVAQRPTDPGKWAIVWRQQNFDDDRLSAMPGSANGNLIETLTTNYGVPREQVIVLRDESRIRLAKAIPDALAKAAQARQLIVSVAGRGFADEDGKIFLAPKEFALDRIAASGVPLKWLIEQIEESTANDKLLLFDTGFSSPAAGAPALSSAEMIATIQGTKSKPGLRTTTVIASGVKGETEPLQAGSACSVFDAQLAKAFAGDADRNRDLSIDAPELMDYFQQLASSGGGLRSHPELFLPNNTPPRLTDEAKQAIRVLAAVLNQPKIDANTVRRNFEDAKSLAGKEPEADALFALLLLKARQFPESLRRAEEVKAAHPQVWPIYEMNVWNRFSNRDYTAAVIEMGQMVNKLAALPASEKHRVKEVAGALRFFGQLREYAEKGIEERGPKPELLTALDAAVAKLGEEPLAAYNAGRADSSKVFAEFDAEMRIVEDRLASSDLEDDRLALSKLRFERRELRRYATFPFDTVAQSILAKLEE